MAGSDCDTGARILAAAEDLVIREGVGKLTLDSAAKEAGISKGGILYHFPSRAALVSAMVERFVISFEAELITYDAYSKEPGAFTRAYLQASLQPAESSVDPRESRLGGALLAGVTSDPELLEPMRERYEAWQAALEHDGVPAEVATAVRLAADGLWLADLFGLAPVTGKARVAVGRLLISLLEEKAAPAPRKPRR
jgi:AcrR family transcriptional regulator